MNAQQGLSVGSSGAQSSANEAVWLTAKLGKLEIGPAPYPQPGMNQIVVRNHAVAINPVDWLMPTIGDFVFPWLTYPFILGTDVAGEVVAAGDGVTRFKLGDRVLGHATGAEKGANNPAQGAFQRYTVLLEHMASPVPDSMSYETAAVLPLGLSTAACALFQTDHLALQYPSRDAPRTGKTVLVWGGSTSVGSNAIQLAVAAGYDVVTTASPRNFDYVRRLGAAEVFDHGRKHAVAEIIDAFRGRTLAGAIAIGAGSAEACLAVVNACSGNRFVSMATPPVSFVAAPEGWRRTLWLVPTLARLLAKNAWIAARSRSQRIRMKFIRGGALVNNEVGPLIYRDFLPGALAAGRFAAAPDPWVAGQGLQAIPAAMALQKKGVSARKVVVSL